MSTDLTALQNLVNLIGDAAKDTVNAVGPGESFLARFSNYENLLPDFVSLASSIGEIPAEVSALQPADYVTLVEGLVSRLEITNAHAELVIQAALKLLTDAVTVIGSDVTALLLAIRNAPPAA
jgi:hypothetical protein